MFALQYSVLGPPEVLDVAEAAAPHAGPGEVRIRVRTAGVAPADAKLRAGESPMSSRVPLPHIPGVDAAGVVDEVGDGSTGYAVGDEVFGAVDVLQLGGASAEFAVLTFWARKPSALTWEEAGAAASSVETATRVLDALSVSAGSTLLVEGASGGVGSVLVQLAIARGAQVVGTASRASQDLVAGLGAVATTYGTGLAERVRHLAPAGVDAAVDVAAAGSLPELVTITGDPGRVVTIADLTGPAHGVRLSHSGPGGGPDGRHGLAVAAGLADAGRFRVPVHRAFPLGQGAQAHRLTSSGGVRGKIVLTLPGHADHGTEPGRSTAVDQGRASRPPR